MDHFARLKRQLGQILFLALLASNASLLAGWWILEQLHLPFGIILAILALIALVVSGLISVAVTRQTSEPIRYLWQAILHVSPEHQGTPAPNLQQLKIGQELVTNLCLQVYQLASTNGGQIPAKPSASSPAQTMVDSLPLPLFAMDKTGSITYINEAAAKYLGVPSADLLGKNMYSVLDLSFANTDTLDSWLKTVRGSTVTASNSWDRVRLNQPGRTEPLQFDMAAYYTKDSPTGLETMLALFDHTRRYSKDDESFGFIALAVHELRTPLTLLRGYIEVFEDELANSLNAEQTEFMHKMEAAAQQLAAFVNNILNVARVESDQLVLQLHEEKWEDIVEDVAKDLKLRAGVRHKTIEVSVASDMPTVAADRVSIYEVLANLLDNAIKYSHDEQRIIIHSALTKDGMVETTVQDFGVGIPDNIVSNLFEKFYRNHHTQQQIGGTGLGLYLAKAIIKAHGGNIWVRSKEGQGTTFGFTLMPYTRLASELKNSDNKDIVRGAYGWIKNHSMYRR
ncbi:MAG TPA: ATP-binding protein [Patescibacteria group bacterium]|nr:ATP-binding protein [Patescibacteria group bacterium]